MGKLSRTINPSLSAPGQALPTTEHTAPPDVGCCSKTGHGFASQRTVASAMTELMQCSKQNCQIEKWWMTSRLRQTSPELASEPSENVLDRRRRSDVKGFIENLTQLIDTFD